MNVRTVRVEDGDALASLGAELAVGSLVECGDAHLLVEDGDSVIAHGFFRRLYGPAAELGLVAAGDDRVAAATLLVRALVAQARDSGLTRLIADLDTKDDVALSVMRRAGRTRENVAGERVEVELFPQLSG